MGGGSEWKGQGDFWGADNVLYLALDSGYTSVFILFVKIHQAGRMIVHFLSICYIQLESLLFKKFYLLRQLVQIRGPILGFKI